MPTKGTEQQPLERNFLILIYLKKFDGDWKNKNEIANNYPGHGLHRGRIDPILDGFVVKGFIEKREAKNPQAKWEYKITDVGKSFVKRLAVILKDPDMRFMAGIQKEFDDLDMI